MVHNYFTIFLFDIFKYALFLSTYFLPSFALSLEDLTYWEDTFNPGWYNLQVQSLSESIDELMDSWSDSAGADETTDSSSTLVFGTAFLNVNLQGMQTYIPLCINPASDMNIMLHFCEDCVLGTLLSLIPILGFRTYSETVTKDIPFITIPIFIVIEIAGQTMRVLSIALRMAINVTAGHNVFFIILNFVYAFIVCSVKIKYQVFGILFSLFALALLSIDSVIASVQSYVIIIIETYYELDSE